MRERTMGDKSPNKSTSKKPAGKSIKEKRAERKAKAEATPSQMARLTAQPKHPR